MNITARYTVNCSHDAFQKAMEELGLKEKFHEIAWRSTENMGDDEDQDLYSSFSYPVKAYPELTHNLFWKMATWCLAFSDHAWTALYVEMFSEGNSIRISDGWIKDHPDRGEGPRLRYKENAFSAEMADRLKQIATLALGHKDGDY